MLLLLVGFAGVMLSPICAEYSKMLGEVVASIACIAMMVGILTTFLMLEV
jgi:hypothetical protein